MGDLDKGAVYPEEGNRGSDYSRDVSAYNARVHEGLSDEDIEAVIHDVFNQLPDPERPTRFAMSDLSSIGAETIVTLKASSIGNIFLPHIQRINATEKGEPTPAGCFVPRVHKRQPDVVYSVRWACRVRDP